MKIRYLFAILLSLLLAVPVSAGDLHKRGKMGALISAATLAASRSFEVENTIQGMSGGTWGLLLLWVKITDADNSETGVSVTCTGSEDNNTTDYRVPACVWDPANTRYNCEAAPMFWNPTDETSPKKQLFRVDVEGIEDVECTFAFTGGSADDSIDVSVSFAIKG